jgi:polyisoprenoid-binding protein YceI
MAKYIPFVSLVFGVAAGTTAANDATPVMLEVSSGTVAFEVGTNVPGVEVKGKTNAVTAHIQINSTAEGVLVQRMDALVPVRTLSTGMKVRDEHMRKYVFTTADGQMPDILFSASEGVCTRTGPSHDLSCRVPGALEIRGTSHPVEITVAAKEEKSARAFHATGSTTVKLTDFHIEAPSQLGVKTSNEVKLRFDFTAKQKDGTFAALTDGK